MNTGQKSLAQAIDHLGHSWLQLQAETTSAEIQTHLEHEEQKVLFIHPISFLKCMILQLNDGSEPSYRALLKESYRYQRVPTQHVNDYCFGRSLKYLCMDGEFRLSDRKTPKPGDIVISACSKSYININWAICGSNGQLYHVNDLSDRIIISSLDQENTLIHIIELSDLRLTIKPDSVWSYYTSPYVRSELSS